MIHYMVETENTGWGGKRDNQNGRPKLPPELRRIAIHARVEPKTHKFLTKDKDGIGKAIDKLVRKKA